ncbi:MAG: carboxypeptidase regulatory-like domain-containing protein [Myxococcota bacterium]|jgi:hypothetical protein
MGKKGLMIALSVVVAAGAMYWHYSARKAAPSASPETVSTPEAAVSRATPVSADRLKSLTGAITAGPERAKQSPLMRVSASPDGKIHLKGFVVEATGGAPGSCRVYIRESDGIAPTLESRFISSTKTGIDGSVSFDDLPAGKWDILAACDRGIGRVVGIESAPGGVSDFGFLKLEQGGRLRGKVVDAPSGRAIPGAHVSLVGTLPEPAGPEQSPVFTGETDSEGKFELFGVAQGSWTIRVESVAYKTESFAAFRTPGSNVIDMHVIALDRADH